MEKIKVFGYATVSPSSQVMKGFSLEQQKEEITKFCSCLGNYIFW